MTGDELLLRRAVVCGSALIYWGGVMIQAQRIRRQIGRSPNLKPQGKKEKVLWTGWLLVIASWFVQPLLIRTEDAPVVTKFIPALYNRPIFLVGLGLILAGYAGTLWCYAAMGSAWRIGVNRDEKNSLVTGGPYAFVRHPIYSCQVVMLLGCICLLPTLASIVILAVHFICVTIKARDEEAYLLGVHGESYRAYMNQTGRLFPHRLGWRTRS